MSIHGTKIGAKPNSGDHPAGAEDEAEAAFYEAQAVHGYYSAQALVAGWHWRSLRQNNRLKAR